MTAAEIEAWLQTDESRRVGSRRGGGCESVGHARGRRIVGILGKPATELTDEDYAHMRKVVGFVRRHGAQRPENIYTSRWRYSLMNWGTARQRRTSGEGFLRRYRETDRG